MTPTEAYIDVLSRLKTGEIGLLRAHAGQGLDETVDGFDLFAGLWWPLRQKDARAPRRAVAWLIAKLYAFSPLPQAPGLALARQLRACQPRDARSQERYQLKFDQLLSLPLDQIEPALRWALDQLARQQPHLDWVQLTDDLSRWEHDDIRLKWAKQFLDI